jgi:hypothetical protein
MKAHIQEKTHPRNKESGQSLVEMTIILPFLLVLLVGVVEAGVALNRQLTVVNAAREGARFGAFGATPSDIHTQTLEATSEMFEFTDENAVVVVINAETDDNCAAFDEWTEEIYPTGADVPHVSQDEVLAELQAEGDCENLALVVVDVRYDHESVLGLPFVGAMADEIPIGSWTVMRLAAPKVGRGNCCALPIALDTTTVNWPTGLSRSTLMDDIRVGDGPGMFGWLYWDPDSQGSAVNLEANLQDRCNAYLEFKDACDNEETALKPGVWISGDSGQSVASGVRQATEALIGARYPVPVWDQFAACNDMPGSCNCKPGSQLAHIVDFALIEVVEVNLTSNPKTISARFIEFYRGCDPPAE